MPQSELEQQTRNVARCCQTIDLPKSCLFIQFKSCLSTNKMKKNYKAYLQYCDTSTQ